MFVGVGWPLAISEPHGFLAPNEAWYSRLSPILPFSTTRLFGRDVIPQ